MSITFKKLDEHAVIPVRGTPNSVGLDLTALGSDIVATSDHSTKLSKYNSAIPLHGNDTLISESDYKIVANAVYSGDFCYVHTGLAVQPPPGYFFEIHARSSLHKSGWALANSVGVIDPDYRGELVIPLVCLLDFSTPPKDGTRIAQLVLKKSDLDLFEIKVGELDDTIRGEGGFGSTG